MSACSDFLAERPQAAGVRFGVRKTGAPATPTWSRSADRLDEGDRLIEQDGVKLVVDHKSLPFVEGTEIDFTRQGLNASFVFRNPNVTGECGCGESFTVDEPGLEG